MPAALFALRSNVCSTTGLTPYQILFGCDVCQPLDCLFGSPKSGLDASFRDDPQAYTATLKRRLHKAHAYVRHDLETAVSRQHSQYNQDKKCFFPGTKVWLFTRRTSTGNVRRLKRYWTGPWVICNQPINATTVRIAPHPSWPTTFSSKVVTVNRLKLYTSHADHVLPHPKDDLSMLGDEFAEFLPPPAPAVPPPNPADIPRRGRPALRPRTTLPV